MDLPVRNVRAPSDVFQNVTGHSVYEFEEMTFTDHVRFMLLWLSGDCWSVVMDDDIIFNRYSEELVGYDHIREVHSSLSEMNENDIGTIPKVIELYMLGCFDDSIDIGYRLRFERMRDDSPRFTVSLFMTNEGIFFEQHRDEILHMREAPTHEETQRAFHALYTLG